MKVTLCSMMAMASVNVGMVYSQTGESNTVKEDFVPAVTNQEGKQYPMVNSQRMVRAQITAPNALSVKLDIGGVKYELKKDDKGGAFRLGGQFYEYIDQ